MANENAVFRFRGHVVDFDPTGYYYIRWDKATPFSVVAKTRREAEGKVAVMMGDPPRGRRWTISWGSITEELNPNG